MPVTVIRISETYGPGDNRLLKLFKAVKKGRFLMIGSGLNVRQLIYVDDLIDGMFRAAERAAERRRGLRAGGRGDPDHAAATVDTIASGAWACGPSKLRLPFWPFLVLAVIMETTMRPLGLQPPLHRRRLDFFQEELLFLHAEGGEGTPLQACSLFRRRREAHCPKLRAIGPALRPFKPGTRGLCPGGKIWSRSCSLQDNHRRFRLE
jgi:hypothetical protein